MFPLEKKHATHAPLRCTLRRAAAFAVSFRVIREHTADHTHTRSAAEVTTPLSQSRFRQRGLDASLGEL